MGIEISKIIRWMVESLFMCKTLYRIHVSTVIIRLSEIKVSYGVVRPFQPSSSLIQVDRLTGLSHKFAGVKAVG